LMTRMKAQTTSRKTTSTKTRQVVLADRFSLLIDLGRL
jgi:hypothetical protein